MNIEWSDGHHGVYPHEILRGYCPCADCQGHSGDIKFKEGGNLEILDLQSVGNYAITITWGDGHNAGIYNFDYLRSLCWCSTCHPEGLPTEGSELPPSAEKGQS